MKFARTLLYYIEESFICRSLILLVIGAGVFYYLDQLHADYFISMGSQCRQALYSAAASAATALLGFVITASTVLITLRYDPAVATLAKDKKLTIIYRSFFESIFLLSISALFSFLCLFSDFRAEHLRLIPELLISILAITAVRLLSNILLLGDVGKLHLVDIENAHQATPVTPPAIPKKAKT